MKGEQAAARLDERGLTILEAMVAIAVVAALVALAYPFLTRASAQANDRAAQVTLRNSLTTARIMAVDDGTYGSLNATTLAEEEPAIGFVDAMSASTGSTEVSVRTWAAFPGGPMTGVTLASLSDSGDCHYLRDDLRTASTEFGTREAGNGGTCAAENSDAVTWGSWG